MSSSVPLYQESRWWPWTPEQVWDIPLTFERWQGSVALALTELQVLVETGRGNEETIWHPSRITAALVRATMKQPRVASVNQVIAFTQKLFSGTATPEDVVKTTAVAASHGIFADNADQTIDRRTLISTNPELAHAAAGRLHEQQQGKDIFMIPLGNSGITAGVMTALAYQALSGSEIPVYPLRFSTKSGNFDGGPRINPDEVAYIGERALNKTIVVFNEDSTSGRRTIETIEHLRLILPAGQEFIGLSTDDKRSSETVQTQGVWWEHGDPHLARWLQVQAEIERQIAAGTYDPYKNYATPEL